MPSDVTPCSRPFWTHLLWQSHLDVPCWSQWTPWAVYCVGTCTFFHTACHRGPSSTARSRRCMAETSGAWLSQPWNSFGSNQGTILGGANSGQIGNIIWQQKKGPLRASNTCESWPNISKVARYVDEKQVHFQKKLLNHSALRSCQWGISQMNPISKVMETKAPHKRSQQMSRQRWSQLGPLVPTNFSRAPFGVICQLAFLFHCSKTVKNAWWFCSWVTWMARNSHSFEQQEDRSASHPRSWQGPWCQHGFSVWPEFYDC